MLPTSVHHPHQNHPKRILFFLIVIVLCFGVVKSLSSSSNTPSPSISPAPSDQKNTSPSPISLPSCLEASRFDSLTNKTWQNVRATPVIELQKLECSYTASETVRDILPRIQYTIELRVSDEEWQKRKASVSQTNSFRRIEENQNIVAQLNPVLELNQATFYAYKDGTYLELTYTPVQLQPGELLKQGVTLSNLVLNQ
jgi:hypothetical protein